MKAKQVHRHLITARLSLLLLAAVILLSPVVPAFAAPPPARLEDTETVNLPAVEDTWMNGNYFNTTYNYGGAPTLQADAYNLWGFLPIHRHILLRWDLSSIPAGATVTSASLTFNVTESSNYDYNLFAMRQAWVEGTNNGATGTGASWTYYGAGTGEWSTEGATNTVDDRYDTDLWDAAAASFNVTGSQTVPLNSSGVAAIQGWLTGSLANNGLTIQTSTLLSETDPWVISSSENATPANRPTLNITYDYTPTAVTISDFHADPGDASITVRWQTALEVDLLGFNLYRATSPDGEMMLLNPELIPAANFGQLMGAEYEFVDTGEAGQEYYYWLEVLDLTGQPSDLLGPDGPYAVLLPALQYKMLLPILVR